MARTNIPIIPANGFADDVELTWTAADAANGMKLLNVTGRVILLVRNTDASTHNVTVKAVVKAVHADDIAVAVAQNIFRMIGPLPVDLFTQPSGTDINYVQIDIDVATGMSLTAVAV